MTEDDHKGQSRGEQQLGFDSDSSSNTTPQQPRKEPVFSGFDEEDEYEEPDRDTDFAAGYREEEAEDYPEEEFDDGPDEHEEELTATALMDSDGESLEEDWDDPADEDREEWQDEYQDEYEEQSTQWPLGLIAVAVLALVLLGAGGYGVIQQRAADQEEIRALRAQLATAASPAEVNVSNDALLDAKQRNVELSMALESMKLENRRLTDTVAGLEAQLEAQQKALSRPAPKPAAVAKPSPAPAKPAPAPASKPTAAPAGGDWFVNFGSYSQRELAESWAAKLKPSAGRSTVTTASKDGRTFYRVRVVDLDSQETADRIARQLESQHGLSKLWVGK
jgi:cell division septation protein DedD